MVCGAHPWARVDAAQADCQTVAMRGRPGALDRRSFLSLAGAAFGAAPFHALACRAARRNVSPGRVVDSTSSRTQVGYGPLAPVEDEVTRLPLLHLPAGFRYRSCGWIGDPLARGLATPGMHDGMAAFPAGGSRVRLVRNHELRAGPRTRRSSDLRSERLRRHDHHRVRHEDRLGRRCMGEPRRHPRSTARVVRPPGDRG